MAKTLSVKKRAEINRELIAIAESKKGKQKPSLERKERIRPAKPNALYAYDLETTNIKVGTPRPLYITAYGDDLHFASVINDMSHLEQILTQYFLTDEMQGARYVAWNGNRFDAFFIAAALIANPRYRLKPYLTKTKTLRGLLVTLIEDGDKKTKRRWEFLDGIAMLGLVGVKLEKLLQNFAPDHLKLTDNIDFESGDTFNPKNKKHCDYAMRDSVGLYHAMRKAESIMLETFGEPLSVTMGAVCIKIFSAHIPREVTVNSLVPELETIVFDYVMRGGYCHCVRPYHGPVWKYDINQAYAAAMRETNLPCGPMMHGNGKPPMTMGCFVARISATNPRNKIPFYHRTIINGRLKSCFALHEIKDTWITSTEYKQLQSEGWRIEGSEFWVWAQRFTMQEYVDKLEVLRMNCDGGPSGPIGTMVKATGNHSYGKTVEQIEPIDFFIAAECPPECHPYYGDDESPDPIEHIYYRFDPDRRAKAHHQPHLGAFITAHVRMVVRRAALVNPDAWLYADTDCVIFSQDVTNQLDIDAKRYGAWKIEDQGTIYRIITKKVYAEDKAGGKRSAKGLNVKKLTDADFVDWYEGKPPAQDQIQINNFLTVMQGAEMYRAQHRRGTAIKRS